MSNHTHNTVSHKLRRRGIPASGGEQSGPTERLQCNAGAATAASATLVPPPRRSSRRLTSASVSTPVPHEIRSIDDSRAQSTASKKRKAPTGSSTDQVSVEPSSKKPATTQAMMHHAESSSSSSVMQSRPLSTVGTLLVSISILLVERWVVFIARYATAPLLTYLGFCWLSFVCVVFFSCVYRVCANSISLLLDR